jgi:hypothetical protein
MLRKTSVIEICGPAKKNILMILLIANFRAGFYFKTDHKDIVGILNFKLVFKG